MTPTPAQAQPLTPQVDAVARAICRETCAFKGEAPCFEIEADNNARLPWPPDTCDEPGCAALAQAVVDAAKPPVQVDRIDGCLREIVWDESLLGTPLRFDEAQIETIRNALIASGLVSTPPAAAGTAGEDKA